ncbi:hypothetical protein J2S21_000855 [Peribacillus cavernae]|nr:hypothetical protein [Peribacillus cavernae]
MAFEEGVMNLITFKRNELLKLNNMYVSYFAQNHLEYLFIALENSEGYKRGELIIIAADNISLVQIEPVSHNSIFSRNKKSFSK